MAGCMEAVDTVMVAMTAVAGKTQVCIKLASQYDAGENVVSGASATAGPSVRKVHSQFERSLRSAQRRMGTSLIICKSRGLK